MKLKSIFLAVFITGLFLLAGGCCKRCCDPPYALKATRVSGTTYTFISVPDSGMATADECKYGTYRLLMSISVPDTGKRELMLSTSVPDTGKAPESIFFYRVQ